LNYDNFLLQILKWEPEYYKSTKDLPEKMPENLKKHIEEMAKKESIFVSSES
jgi:hypothetical protein